MAPILSRLLSHRKHSSKSSFTDDFTDYQSKKLSKFDSEKQVRLVLYRDCHLKGRKLLFDSKTIKRKVFSEQSPRASPARLSPLNLRWNANTKQLQPCPVKQNRKVEISEGGVMYEFLQPSPDTTMLGEMILGSVALSYQGSMKVHTMRFPSQLMLSVVFPAPIREPSRDKSTKESVVMHNSTSEININNKVEKAELPYSHSVPMDVPGAISFMAPFAEPLYAHESLQSSISNTSTQSHPFLSENSNLIHSNSFNNLHRRKMRNFTTSLEYGVAHNTAKSTSLDNLPAKRKVNLGLSIIINLEKLEEEESLFEDFFFSHINLIECHMHKLKQIVTDAYFQGKNFIDNIYKGFEKILKTLQDLYAAPRLQFPMWLTIMTSVDDLQTKYSQLVEEFVSLLEDFDTKNTNFFVSTLLTAVLTYHLSWVSTVVPSKVYSHQNFHQKNKSKWMDQVAKSHSYNPLWLQLRDIYGATDYKPKVTRIIVTGKKMNIIYRFLFVLSYFIRCCDVYDQEQEMVFLPENYICLDTRHSPVKRPNTAGSPVVLNKDKVHDVEPIVNYVSDSCEKYDRELQNKTLDIKDNPESLKVKCQPLKTENGIISEITLVNDLCENGAMAGKISKQKEEKKSLDDKMKLQKILCWEKFHSNHKNSVLANHNSKQLDRIFKEKQNVEFFIGENPKIDQQIRNNFATKEERLKWHDFVCQANHFLCKECKDKDFCEFCEHFRNSNVYNDKSFQDLLSSVESTLYDSKDPLANKSMKNINEIENMNKKHKYSNHPEEGKLVCSLPYKIDHVIDNSNLFANPLFTVNEIEENDDNATSENDTHLEKSKTANQDIPLNKDNQTFIQSIDDSKLFMQEYHNLRFTPQKSIGFTLTNEQDAKSKLEVNCDNYCIRSESPEEGYHSMEDTKQNQTEFCLKNTNTPFQVEELFDNLPNRLEMPFLRIKERERKKENVYKSLGWSLMAGINDHFMPCFCLQGIHGDFRNKLNYRNLRDEIVEDLVASAKFSFIEDEVSEALCILADTDHWKIELLSSSSVLSNTNNNPVMMSPLISEICESLTQMYLLDITPENCVMYLESRLQELYFRSLSLAEFVNNSSSIELDNIAKSLKLDPSDIPLLLAIVSRPSLALAY